VTGAGGDSSGAAATPRPRAIVVAGVSGSGKTTVGRALATRLGWSYVEADDHHSSANKAKMARGEPLDDADRAPWLASLRRALDDHLDGGRCVVMSCSALKRRYREALVGSRHDVAVVLLHAPEPVIAQRLSGRTGHFFDPRLLRSQFDALELPAPDEGVVVVDARLDGEAVLSEALQRLRLAHAGGPT
jgi:gluconokinase